MLPRYNLVQPGFKSRSHGLPCTPSRSAFTRLATGEAQIVKQIQILELKEGLSFTASKRPMITLCSEHMSWTLWLQCKLEASVYSASPDCVSFKPILSRTACPTFTEVRGCVLNCVSFIWYGSSREPEALLIELPSFLESHFVLFSFLETYLYACLVNFFTNCTRYIK